VRSNPPRDASEIDIEAGVGAGSRLGYVRLRWGSQSGQLTTREARIHAHAILDAAAAADHDATVYRWLTTKMKMKEGPAAQVLMDLREARAQVDIDSDNSEG
jgi:hypothetical protein